MDVFSIEKKQDLHASADKIGAGFFLSGHGARVTLKSTTKINSKLSVFLQDSFSIPGHMNLSPGFFFSRSLKAFTRS